MLASRGTASYNDHDLGGRNDRLPDSWRDRMGVKKTGKGRRKLGQKKRRMRARIRHRKG
jgi:hypothetical protein